MADKDTNIAIVIAAAGVGRRMRSYGPKSLLTLSDGTTLLNKQIETLKTAFPSADIIVVVGYESEKVIATLPPYVRVVENEFYEITNVARSICLGLRATTAQRVIAVYGDIVFSQNSVKCLPTDQSSILIEPHDAKGEPKIGATTQYSHVLQLGYGLDNRWCHIVSLMGEELRLFKQLGGRRDKRKSLGHEMLNEIINKGGSFKSVSNLSKIVEINSTKDMKEAKLL